MNEVSTGTGRAAGGARPPSPDAAATPTRRSQGRGPTGTPTAPPSRALRPRTLLWGAVAAYAAGFSALSALRHEAFNSGRFDLGNMVQPVWSTAHGKPLEMTDINGEQISRLAAHFDPVLAAFAPLWRLWPSPHLLLVTQAASLALGAVAVFWLARKHLASEHAALGFALAYLLYPPVQWLTLDDFHAVALACPLLLFAFWYLDENRLLPFSACAFVALLTREEAGLVVAGFGLWYALARRRRLTGVATALGGGLAAMLTIGVVIPHFNAHASSGFYSRYREVGGSPGGILRTAISDPLRLLEVAFDRAGVEYVAELLLPLGALAVLAPLAMVAALPQLAINLLSATPTQTSIHFHYTALLIPPLVAATVLGAARLAHRRGWQATSIASLLAAVALVSTYRLGAIPLWHHFPGGEILATDAASVSSHDHVAARALALIPRDAPVSASNSLGAHLSARERVFSFPVLREATWVALDETKPSFRDRLDPLPMALAAARLRRAPAWRLVFQRDGIVVFRRVRAS